jgi:glycosyltransferase involved in cell wall biosynthesis
MKIAQIAPLYESVPPPAYGGTERVIAALCDGLTDLGHQVTLFAAGTSETAAVLQPHGKVPLRLQMDVAALREEAPHRHLHMLSDAYSRSMQFDVIHAHTDIWTLPFTRITPIPTVVTLHGRLDLPATRNILALYPDVPLVSISDDQRRAVDDLRLNWAATVPHGLDLGDYFGAVRTGGEHVIFVGRVCEEKGVDRAIDVARRAGRRLHIAAKVDPFDVHYFHEQIEPLFDDDVSFLGEVSEAEKPALYAGATATLFPGDWPEPFGLVMVESLAAGTPVIALRRGSVPEVLVDGITGFICDDDEQMVLALERINEIDPAACRQRAVEFSRETMCRNYVEVYRSLRQRSRELDRRPVLRHTG